MTLITGRVAEAPIEVQKECKKQLIFKFEEDISGNTIKFKVRNFASQTNLSIDLTATSATYSAPYTTVTFDLTDTQTALGFSRGMYSVHDETDDYIKAAGPFLVVHYPE